RAGRTRGHVPRFRDRVLELLEFLDALRPDLWLRDHDLLLLEQQCEVVDQRVLGLPRERVAEGVDVLAAQLLVDGLARTGRVHGEVRVAVLLEPRLDALQTGSTSPACGSDRRTRGVG